MASSNSLFLDYDIRKLTIGEILEKRAAEIGDKVYLNYLETGRQYTYAEINSTTNRWANSLISMGIVRGTHVAVMMDNCAEQLLLYFALGKIGAVTVPINTASRGDLLKYYLELADVEAVFVDLTLLDRIAEVRADLPKLAKVIGTPTTAEDAEAEKPDGSYIRFSILENSPDTPPAERAVYSDPAFIAFTSGTTGPSKAVIFGQAAMLLTGLNYARSYGYSSTDVYYICLPLFHASALRGAAYLSLMSEGSIALTRRFSVSRFWSDVRKAGATTFNLLGSMANFIWSTPPSPEDRNHNVRFCRVAPVPKFAREFEDRFNVRFVSTYGLTDVGAPVSYTLDDPRDKLGSCGRAREGWEVMIVDSEDFELPRNEVGEIVIRCNVPWHTSSGYYKMPLQTLAMVRNGWYHTGDLGYMDKDGYLYFKDRAKDSIRRRGENISAWEVEQTIQNHPAVQEVAAYAVKSELSEDEVAVSIVLRTDQQLTEAALIEYCASKMAYFMVPRFVQYVKELPVNASQKVLKVKLREAAQANPDLLWDRDKAGVEVRR
ncbi:AMP-binding protein [Ensifer sp. 2YAB10]|uniref:AMP-binding protein n=1 Tax=Pseudomonadota TaxID=1224 RepID=UPI0039F6B267